MYVAQTRRALRTRYRCVHTGVTPRRWLSMAADSSTPTTSCPRAASTLASRPVPQPSSKIREPSGTALSIRSGSPFAGRCKYTSTVQPSGVTTPPPSIQTTLTDEA